MRRVPGLVTLAVVLGLGSATAQAQPASAPAEDDPRTVEARKACIAGDVEKGVALLAEYFASTEDTTAIYNIGRCYEQNGFDGKALPRFREFLLKAKDLAPEERGEIERHIKTLESRLGPQTAPPPPQASVQQPASERSPALPPLSMSTDDRRRRLRIAGLIAAGAGGIALGTGAVFALKVNQVNKDLAAERRKEAPEAGRYQRLLDSGRSAQALQWVFVGLGGAALAGGVTCYLLGTRDSTERHVAAAPWVGSHGAGGSFSVTF